jgi:hypothetical protein
MVGHEYRTCNFNVLADVRAMSQVKDARHRHHQRHPFGWMVTFRMVPKGRGTTRSLHRQMIVARQGGTGMMLRMAKTIRIMSTMAGWTGRMRTVRSMVVGTRTSAATKIVMHCIHPSQRGGVKAKATATKGPQRKRGPTTIAWMKKKLCQKVGKAASNATPKCVVKIHCGYVYVIFELPLPRVCLWRITPLGCNKKHMPLFVQGTTFASQLNCTCFHGSFGIHWPARAQYYMRLFVTLLVYLL